MEEMWNALHANNSTKPASIPEWKPKSFNKSLDIDMSVKEYTGIEISKSLPFAADYASSSGYKRLIKYYLDDLTHEQINGVITILKNGFMTGKSIREIAQQIEKIIGDYDRAEKIARTEVVRLSNEGNLVRMENRGFLKAKFVSAPEDGRLCKKCRELDGKTMTIEEAKGTLPIHVNCRCLYTEYIEI
jgi:SPP1 gp7 family putative phage head morphogenesis protein